MQKLNQQIANFYKFLLLRGKHRSLIRVLLLLCGITACKEFVEVPLPPTETYPPDVFSSDLTATAAVTAIYGNMINGNGWASGNTQSITFLSGLSADELENYSSGSVPREFYENAININNTAVDKSFWGQAYKYIYAANAILEGLDRSSGVSSPTKKQLQGEALFVRAFCHFYLVNLFGDAPYLNSTDYKANIVKFRTPKAEVYKYIIKDLVAAQDKLDSTYKTLERVRPNKWAATAFLARVYLYTGNWAAAANQATRVIDQSSVYGLDSLNGVFLKNSKEAIWQLMPNNTEGFNTWEGKNFILNTAPATGESNSAILSTHLLQAFESGDLRRSSWVDSVVTTAGNVYYFPSKYKVQRGAELKEYSMVLRLAELYLIRAEAYARLGNVTGARIDLDLIRQRAGLPGTTAGAGTTLLKALARERQVELFTEWGHRWFDLKRTDEANDILLTIKASGWQPTDVLYPIPQNERALNLNLTQNPGYN